MSFLMGNAVSDGIPTNALRHFFYRFARLTDLNDRRLRRSRMVVKDNYEA